MESFSAEKTLGLAPRPKPKLLMQGVEVKLLSYQEVLSPTPRAKINLGRA